MSGASDQHMAFAFSWSPFRLVAWSEDHGSRSPVQAGFHPQHSPILHLFALRRFIDRAILQRRPLFVAFVDLQKAYDIVQHDLLWAHLEAIGVNPRMMAAFRSRYSSGVLSMRVGSTADPPPCFSRMECGRGALSALPCLAFSLMACMAICTMCWGPAGLSKMGVLPGVCC